MSRAGGGNGSLRRSICLLAPLAVATAIGVAAAPPATSALAVPIVRADGSKCYGRGVLRFIGGVPVLRLAGGYYEMGYQYGVLLRDELQKAYADYSLLRRGALGRYPWYVRPFSNIALNIMANSYWQRIPRDYQEELRGLAEGALIPFEEVRFSAVFPEIANSFCTTVMTRTAEGVLLGRNLDFQPIFIGRYPAVVTYEADGRHAFVSLGVLGYTGVFTGLNERGLAISLNSTLGCYTRSRKAPVTFMARGLLERAASPAEIEPLLDGYHAEVGWVLAAAGADGEGALYDICFDRIYRTALADDHYLLALNKFVHPEANRRYTPILVGASHYNLARADAAAAFMAGGGIDTVDRAIDFLANADYGGHHNLIGTGNGTINNERTLQSAVLVPGEGAVYFAFARGYAGWADFSRHDLKTGELSPYRERSEAIAGEDVQGFLDWYDETELSILGGAYEAAAGTTLALERLHPVQIMALEMILDSGEAQVDPAVALAAVDRAIGRHPDYGYLYQLRGKLLLAEGRVNEAIGALTEGIAARILFPVEKIAIYRLMAEAFAAGKDEAGAAVYAKKCLDLLDELSADYAVGKDEKRLYRAMRRLAAGSPITGP